MTTRQPYPEEFRVEAARRITERGHRVADVSARIGMSQHSPCEWMKVYAVPASERQSQTSQAEELRQLKAEPNRVTEERNVLKKAVAYLVKQSGRGARSSRSTSTACGACAEAMQVHPSGCHA